MGSVRDKELSQNTQVWHMMGLRKEKGNKNLVHIDKLINGSVQGYTHARMCACTHTQDKYTHTYTFKLTLTH